MNWISARYILMSTDWRKKLHRLFALLISDMEIEDLQSQGFETSCFAFHPDGRWKTLRRWLVWKCFYFLLFFLFLLGGTSIHAKESSSTSGGCSGWRLRLLRWRVFHLRRLLRWKLQWRQWNDRSQQWSTYPGFWSCAGRPGVQVRFSFCWGTFRLCVGCYPVAWPKSGECGGCWRQVGNFRCYYLHEMFIFSTSAQTPSPQAGKEQ